MSLRILLIENDATVVNAITRLYRVNPNMVDVLDHDAATEYVRTHHEFVTQTDIDCALEWVRNNEPPDLILLDLRMNGKSRIGLEVYEVARELWGPELFIACITGCDDNMLDAAEEVTKIDPNFQIFKKPLTNAVLKQIFTLAQEKLT
jgi:CheY-like chemotaxis protein